MVFNVSHFTSYSTTGTVNITGCPVTINTSAILGSDISSSTTCITVNADNVELDCNGHKITYNTGGGNNNYGVYAQYRTNATVRNCQIVDNNNAGNYGLGVFFNNTNSSLVANSTIWSNGSSYNSPVYLQASFDNSIENNTLKPRSSIGEIGVYIGTSARNNVTGNDIETYTLGDDNEGIVLMVSSRSYIANNNITTHGNAGNNAIKFTGSDNTTIENNRMATEGTYAHAVYASSSPDCMVAGNRISAEGDGIYWYWSPKSTFAFNNISTTSSYPGLFLDLSNNTNATNTWFNTTGHWINASDSYNNSLHNTTFETTGGKINLPYNFTINGDQDINRARLLPSSTTAKINTVALPFLNTTGIITLYGVGASVPVPTVDYEDDGSYVRCGDVCTELYKSGSNYVFNVTHFTTFSTSETNITSCPVTINESTTLSQSLSSNTTCITIGANNLALNCNGSTITFGINGQPQAAGVKADTKINITVANCTIILGNASARSAHGVNFTSGGNITVINNIIRVNGTGNNTGMHLFYPDYNHLLYNTVMVHGTQDSNYGIRFANSYYNNMTGNNVSVNGTTNNMAMRLSGFSYSNVSANNATAKGTLGDNYGIYLFSTSARNTVENNRISVYGDTGLDYGIYLFSTVTFNNITGNTISTSGPGTDYHGIVLSSSANSNMFYFNNITTAGDNSYSAYIQASDNNRFNNTILNTTAWIYSDFTSTNYFTNTTFVRRNGSIMLRDFTITGINDITESWLNITNNKTYVNTSRYPALNTSGVITLYGITSTDPKPMVSWNDASYTDCPSGVCTELSYAGGAYTFNVTHFTSYASAENTTQITGCPITINESTILTQNIASNDTCITINADSLTLDCRGRTITYDINDSGEAYGINAENRSGITIKDCVVVLGNRSSTSTRGIYIPGTNNSQIINNTLLMNGSGFNHGVYAVATNNVTIAGNRIFMNCSGAQNLGIYLSTHATNDVIENNSIASNSTTGAVGMAILSAGNRINHNNISVTADDASGLYIAFNADNNSINGNRIFANGGLSYGIHVLTSALRNNISNNVVQIAGASTNGISIVSSNNNLLKGNNITLGGNGQYGLYVQLSTGTIINNTVINSTENWAYVDSLSSANFTATTFQSEKGSILLDNFTIDGSTLDILGTLLNTSSNKSFLDSGLLPALNTTGVITLYGITAADPKPVVDWEDDGSYEECPADVCTELGYSGGVFTYNTTHFTSYSSSEGGISIDGCATINTSARLTQDVASNGTCITIGNNSVTFDCAGHTISYSNHGFGYGIWVANRGRVTIKDCVLVLGNNSATGTRAIYLTNSNYSRMQNNTLLINGTDTNDGINLFRSNNNTIIQNVVFANNSGLSNTGIYFGTGSGNNTAEGNSVVMNGTQSNPGIYSYGPGNHRLLYNNITTYGNYSYGIYLLFTSQNNSIIGNTITTEGAFAYGLNFGTDVNYNNITGNRIVSRGEYAYGINLNNLYSNRFEYNNITVNSDTQYGINLQLAPSTFNHTIINSTDNWIYGDSLSISGFEDTTFQSAMGSIKLDNFTIPGVVAYDITSSLLNTSYNQSHLDSATLPALNTSGVITLYGITSTDPKPVVDWGPNNAYIDCPADVCTELSYSGGVYVFNVTHFTRFGSQENATPTPGPSGGGGGSGGQYVGIPRWPAPPAGQMPVQPCVENWECEDWSRCENGAQSRVCVELNGCGTEHKPPTERKCTAERILQPEPIPEYVPEPEVEKPAEPEPSRLLTILPLVIDSLLIALALLAIMAAVMGYDTRSKVWFKALVIVLMVSSLAMLVWHYLANNELLWFQTGAFLVIIIAFIIMQAVDRSRRKLPEGFESTAPMPEFEEHEETRLPAGVEYSPDDIPEPAIQPIPSKVPERAGPRKIYFLTPVGEEPEQEIEQIRPKRGKKPKKEPKVRVTREMPVEPMDLDAVLRRSKKTLTKVGNTIKTLKKKKRK
jgi:hypothetical protein